MNTSITDINDPVSSFAKVLTECKLKFTDITAVSGPSFTLFKVKPVPGAKVSAFKNMEDDIAIGLGARIRITTMPDCIGVEVPRNDRIQVLLHDRIGDEAWSMGQKYNLPIILGDDVSNRLKVVDLAALPHLLVAGATKQGKTVFLRNLIMSLIWQKNREELKFVMIDPKGTELKPFESLRNKYLATLPESGSEGTQGCIATDASSAEKMLSCLCLELGKRYELLQTAGVREINSYNKQQDSRLPYIVCICDEYADLIMGTGKAMKKSIQSSVIRLAAKGRAVGIHMVISTQRPCADVITGLIKANFPARAAFRVVSRVDSTIILDSPGAEKLTGSGDMLFSTGLDCERLQVPYYNLNEMEDEIRKLARDGKGDGPYCLPALLESDSKQLPDDTPDPLYDAAKSLVIMTQECSLAMLQMKLCIGFARAGRLMEKLEADGIIGGGMGKRVVLKKSLND